MMLISPACLESLVQADIQYANLNISTWGQDNQVVTYTYDTNGSVETKTTAVGVTTTEAVVYVYNLQGRLAKVTTTPYVGGVAQTPIVTEYKYDPDGNRVSKTVDSITTTYLVDSYNHTGYSQVFVEKKGADRISYIIGDDVLAQAKYIDSTTTHTVDYLLYDGHGSTRQLVNYDGTIVDDSFSYDAYGVLLGGERAVATNLLYTGEQYDTNLQMYNLRARYYDPLNGRFNQTDPFAGSPQDPQSLHKYLYAHGNPVNGIDPSGTFFISLVLVMAIFAIILSVPTLSNVGSIGGNKTDGICGPDVTQQLKSLETTVVEWFNNLKSEEKKKNHCKSRYEGKAGRDIGWDVMEFKPGFRVPNYVWPEGCATGDCKESVMIDGGCYSSHEANYYMFGVTLRLCDDYDPSWLRLAANVYPERYRYRFGNIPRCKRQWMRAGEAGDFSVAAECGNRCGRCSKCPYKFNKLRFFWLGPGSTETGYQISSDGGLKENASWYD